MTTTTTDNDMPRRKQLSDQLDRLDGILDALGEGLNEAVADAAWEGTRLALKDAIVEIMTDATLRATLHRATAPEPANEPARPGKQPGLWQRLKAGVGRAAKSVQHMAANAVNLARRGANAVANAAVDGVRTGAGLGTFKKLALVGFAAGAAVAAVGSVAPHAVTAGLAGIGRMVAAAAFQAGLGARRAFRALALI
jgi:hypothetical protein